jgi:hypothetical protein
VRIKVDDLGAWIENHGDFSRFELASDLTGSDLDRALRAATAGRWDGEHGWIRRRWILESFVEESPAWSERFAAMVEYAATQGWVNGEGDIRIHRRR